MRPPGLIAALILLLAGCTQLPDEPLRAGTGLWIGYEPLYLARAHGHLKTDEVKLVEYVSNTQAMRGLVDGTVDAAALTLDEALLVKLQGVDIRIVLVMDYSAGADALLARPDIKTLQDLRGQRIGVETTALGAYMMQRILEKSGLTINDVTLVSLELAQHERAYLNGTVDAVITFDPIRSHLLNKGAHVLLDSRELPGEILDVLVIRNSALVQHKQHLKQLLEQWFNELQHIKSDPADSPHHLSTRMKLNTVDFNNALQGVKFPGLNENRQLLIGPQSKLLEQTRDLANIMERNELLSRPVELESLFDIQLLQELYLQ